MPTTREKTERAAKSVAKVLVQHDENDAKRAKKLAEAKANVPEPPNAYGVS